MAARTATYERLSCGWCVCIVVLFFFLFFLFLVFVGVISTIHKSVFTLPLCARVRMMMMGGCVWESVTLREILFCANARISHCVPTQCWGLQNICLFLLFTKETNKATQGDKKNRHTHTPICRYVLSYMNINMLYSRVTFVLSSSSSAPTFALLWQNFLFGEWGKHGWIILRGSFYGSRIYRLWAIQT